MSKIAAPLQGLMDDQTPPASGITWRSLVTGTLGVLLVCGLTPFNEYVVDNTPMVGSYFPVALTFFFFILIVCINAPLHRLAPRMAIRSPELAVIMLMMLVACCIPTQGMMRAFLPTMVWPFYLGRGEPRFWETFLNLHLPGWLFPVQSLADGRTDPVVMDFYNRLPPGGAVPYNLWVRPIIGWGVFVGGMVLTLVSLAWLVREQWAVNERLPFPLAQLELALIEAPAPGKSLNSLFSSRLFWAAMTAVFVFESLAALNQYFPKYFPPIPRNYDLRNIMTQEPWTYISDSIKRNSIFFTFVGLTYFIQSKAAFSLWGVWFFMQLINMEFRVMGSEMPGGAWSDQHLGASLVFVLGVFLIGRQHWARVIRHTISGLSPSERKRGQPSYRAPFLLMLLGLATMIVWLLVVGAQWWVAGLIVSCALLSHFVTTRVVAETGLPIFRANIVPNPVVNHIPITSFTGRDIYFLGTTFMDVGAFTASQSSMNFSLHGLRVADVSGLTRTSKQRWGIAAVITWALVFGVIVCAISSLRCYYSYALTLDPLNPTMINQHCLEARPRAEVVNALNQWSDHRQASTTGYSTGVQVSIGVGVAAVLQASTWLFAWWPIQPVGYIVGTGQYMDWVWFSVMLGWLAKVIIVRFGGPRMFLQARPAFVGMIVGETMAGGIWLAINLILAAAGNPQIPVKLLPN